MWPVAVAIVVCLAGYTYLRLAYAKPGKPHEPFVENQRRIESDKLAAAGWMHAEVAYEAMVEIPAAAAAVRTLIIRPEAVEELRGLSAENWHLPVEYTVLAVPASGTGGRDTSLSFQAELDQARAHIVAFDLYRKGNAVVLIPRWESYPEELTPRRPRASGNLTIPATALPAGTYQVTLPALRQSSQWDLVVAAPEQAK